MNFPKHGLPGLFIAFEGTDGSGNSTQAAMLAERLKTRGYKVVLTKEPTNNIIGGLIRGQLTHDWSTDMKTLQLLFAADRGHHLQKEILPALKQGYVVISDRYFFSTFAFGAIDADRDWLMAVNSSFPLPDVIFWVKVRPTIAAKRIHESRFGVELFEQVEKFKKIVKEYQWHAKEFANYFTIDGERPPVRVAGEIEHISNRYLKKKSGLKKKDGTLL